MRVCWRAGDAIRGLVIDPVMMVELLTAAQSARRSGKTVSHPTKYFPTLPIAIPTPRRIAVPPGGSPTRKESSTELVFDMSPTRSTSAPIPPRSSPDNSQESLVKNPSPPQSPVNNLNFVDISHAPDKAPTPEELFLYTLPTFTKQPSANVPNSRSQAPIMATPFNKFHSQAQLAGHVPSHGRRFRDGDQSEDEFQESSFDSLHDRSAPRPYDAEASRRSTSLSHVRITGFAPSTQKIHPRLPPQTSLCFTPVSARRFVR